MHPIQNMPISNIKEPFITETRVRLRTWLVIGYTLFIVYASLSPFYGWRGQGLNFIEVLRAPLHLTYTGFDAVVNLLAYLPFGLLVGLTLRARFSVFASVIFTLGLGMLLSTAQATPARNPFLCHDETNGCASASAAKKTRSMM